MEGQVKRIEAEGLLAICLQHEIDHLQGTLLLNHASRLKRNFYEKKVRKWQHT
jgi:peptide deformylase